MVTNFVTALRFYGGREQKVLSGKTIWHGVAE
jgi:hypothetical protein